MKVLAIKEAKREGDYFVCELSDGKGRGLRSVALIDEGCPGTAESYSTALSLTDKHKGRRE